MFRASLILLCLVAFCRGDDFAALQRERWARAAVRPEKAHFAEATALAVKRGEARYQAVARATGVPWQVVGCIHSMECGLSFRLGLYCGDPITARTRHVPRGYPRPPAQPPFGWEYCAIDSIRLDGLDREQWGDTGGLLQNIEAYNGTGYQRFHKEVPTPYLWSWTTLYTRGKYVADGRWSPTAASGQCGVVPILRALEF